MKSISALLAIVLISSALLAQTPQKMTYQAVIRNSSNVLVTNHAVGMRISVLQGSASGTAVYVETHTPATNANGLISIEIGGGNVVSGIFASINWSTGTYFIKTETDPAGATNYSITGTTQLLSVPYALHAKTAENGFSGNYQDLSNKPNLFDGQYSNLSGLPTLSIVATNGSYNSLLDKPVLFDGQYSSLLNLPEFFNGDYNSLSNLPVLFDGQYNSLLNLPELFNGDYNTLRNLPVLFDGKFGSLTEKPATIAGYGITDAMTTAHVANTIVPLDIINWNSAYSWGNHADAGYLKTYTEIDPKTGTNTLGYSPQWNGTQFVTGRIFQNTTGIGIGTVTPTNALSVIGSANFSASVMSPLFLPLPGDGTTLTISTNTVATNSNVGDLVIGGGNNNGPQNSSGRAGDIYIAGGTFNVPNPTNPATSHAGNVNISGGVSVTGSGIVGVGGNVTLTGGTVAGGAHGNGGGISLTGGNGNQGGHISIVAGAGVGPGQVYIQGGTSTTLNNVGNVVISGGNKSGGGYFGTVIFRTAEVQQAVIDNAGNFGIGTTPTTKLDVAGIITSTGGNSTNWNTAFGWGNHALAGYLTSYTETDPAFTTNFDFTNVITNDLLHFNGTKWVKFTPDFSLSNHTHADATTTVSGFMSGADKTKLDGLPIPDGSETKITEGNNITVTGNGTTATPYVVGAKIHTVGETYGGGIVFYVYDNGQHGLIAAMTDATVNGTSLLKWIYNSGTARTAGAGSNGIGAGKTNTLAMLAMQYTLTPTASTLSTLSAAVAASKYTASDAQGVQYGDWYLPSSNEMILATQSGVVPGLASYYWSSTEASDDSNYAFAVYGGSISVQGKDGAFNVRAIRSF